MKPLKPMKEKKQPKPYGVKLEDIPKSFLNEHGIPSYMVYFARIIIDSLFFVLNENERYFYFN